MKNILSFAKRKPVLFAILLLLVLSCLCITIGLLSPKSQTEQSTAGTPETKAAVATTKPLAATNTKAPTDTPAPTNTPKPTNTPRPTATPTEVPQPITYTGTGDSVIDIETTWGSDSSIVEITHKGGGNFAVWNVDENNEHIDLLVNTIGNYTGRVAIDLMANQNPTRRLEINAGGSWTIVLYPLSLDYIRICVVPGPCTGTGDDLVALDGDPDTMQVEYPGGGNFAIWSFATERDLLVNEIGPYSGKVLLTNGTFMLVVHAEGPWTLDITAR
jgi:hypothetical protein